MPFDPASVLVYIRVGTSIVELGSAAWQTIRGALDHSDPEVLANLQRLDAEYTDRIARARAAAGLPPTG